MEIRPKVFEDAIRFVTPIHVDLDPRTSYGCCGALRKACRFHHKHYVAFFNEVFSAHTHAHTYWWPLFEPGYTSRIIALQLAACVARDELLGSNGAGKLLSREQWNKEHKKQQEAEWARDALNH